MTSFRLFFILIFLPCLAFGKIQVEQDSLDQFLFRHKIHDSLRVDALNQHAFNNHLIIPDKSLLWAYEALAIAKEINYLKGQAQAMRQIGIVCWAQANYSLALKYFIEGLSLADKCKDKQIIADLTGNVGLVYNSLGDYNEALKYQENALSMQEEMKNLTRISVTLNNIGDIYRGKRDFEKAIEFYQRAYKIREETGNLPGMATNIRNIGNVYEAQGLLTEALKQYNTSLLMSDSLSDKRGMSQCRYSIASVYFKLRQYKPALDFAEKSLGIAQTSHFRSFIRDNYLLISQLHEAMGNADLALKNFKNYSTYKDSVLNVQATAEIASYRLDYETTKQQTQIDVLKKDKALQEIAIDKKNNLLLFAAIIVVTLVVMGGLLFRNYQKQKHLNDLLKRKNDEIARQNQEISAQRDELIALNEEIRAQQDDLVASRDALAEKNMSIARMNEEIITINQNLEKLIRERTFALEKQNQQLIQYAFINAHKLRAPVARILGLANLVPTIAHDELPKILMLLKDSAYELDDITRSISEIVQNGIEAYQK